MKACLIGNNLTSLILAYILSKKKIGVEIYSTKPVKEVITESDDIKNRFKKLANII